MRVTVVGCSGSVPSASSAASCYLVEADGPAVGAAGRANGQGDASGHEAEAGEAPSRKWRVLLDLGSGALGSLQRFADPLDVDAVLLTHLHADHCLDLCGLYVMLQYAPRDPERQAPRPQVWGPQGTADRMARAYDLAPDPGMHAQLGFGIWADREPLRLGPLTITPIQVDHPVPAFGLRVHDESTGGVLAYTGDTDDCPSLDMLCAGADVVLADAAFMEGRDDHASGVHLTAARAGRAATRAGGVGRLVLTHMPPWNDPQTCLTEARTTWSGPLDVAVPGMTLEL